MIPSALLGTNSKSCNPPPSFQASVEVPQTGTDADGFALVARLQRWHLQTVARHTVDKSKGLNNCCRSLIPDLKALPGTLNKVSVLKGTNGYHYGGLMMCGSVWICPICASKISERRRVELSTGVHNWMIQGGGVSLLTLTAPHYYSDKLQTVLTGISDALRRMLNRKGWRGNDRTLGLAAQMGVVGRIRALECTNGANGWHPHFHIMLFTRSALSPVSLALFGGKILDLWISACLAAGLPAPNQHGVSLQDGSDAARYVSKWGADHELTKGHLKKGQKEGHYSPFGLLQLVSDGDKKAPHLYREYAKAFVGKRQLVWSDGLRNLLGLGKEATDEELATAPEEHALLFASIHQDTWRVVLRKEKRGELLQICNQGIDALMDWLINLSDEDLTDEMLCRDFGGFILDA